MVICLKGKYFSDRKEKRYDWSKFRTLSRLEKKYDETLTEYFRAFMAMCKRQCGIRLSEEENESKCNALFLSIEGCAIAS